MSRVTCFTDSPLSIAQSENSKLLLTLAFDTRDSCPWSLRYVLETFSVEENSTCFFLSFLLLFSENFVIIYVIILKQRAAIRPPCRACKYDIEKLVKKQLISVSSQRSLKVHQDNRFQSRSWLWKLQRSQALHRHTRVRAQPCRRIPRIRTQFSRTPYSNAPKVRLPLRVTTSSAEISTRKLVLLRDSATHFRIFFEFASKCGLHSACFASVPWRGVFHAW